MVNQQQKFTENLLNRRQAFFYHYRCLHKHETYMLVIHFNSVPTVLGLYIYLYRRRFCFFCLRLSAYLVQSVNVEIENVESVSIFISIYKYTHRTRARGTSNSRTVRGGKPHFSVPNAFLRDDYVVILMRTVTRLSHRYFRFVGHQTYVQYEPTGVAILPSSISGGSS